MQCNVANIELSSCNVVAPATNEKEPDRRSVENFMALGSSSRRDGNAIMTHDDKRLFLFLAVFLSLLERDRIRVQPRLDADARTKGRRFFAASVAPLPMPNYVGTAARFVGKGKSILEACLHGGWTPALRNSLLPLSLPPSPKSATVVFSPRVCAGHAFANNSFVLHLVRVRNETTKSRTAGCRGRGVTRVTRPRKGK